MVRFLKRLWKNTRRIVLGVAGLILVGFVLLFVGGVLYFIGNALILAMSELGKLCWKYQIVALVILSILGYTAAEFIEAWLINQKRKKAALQRAEESRNRSQ